MKIFNNLFKKESESNDSFKFLFEYKVSEEIQKEYNVDETCHFYFTLNNMNKLYQKWDKYNKKHMFSPLRPNVYNSGFDYNRPNTIDIIKATIKNEYPKYENSLIFTYTSPMEKFISLLKNRKYLNQSLIKFDERKLSEPTYEIYHDKQFAHYSYFDEEYVHDMKPIHSIEELFIVYFYIEVMESKVKSFVNINKLEIEIDKEAKEKKEKEEQHEKDIEEAVEFYKKIKIYYPELIEKLKNK